jgi:hypothetical protein
VLLVPAYAVVVAAPAGPDQGCPSPRQTTDALMARIPAVVVSAEDAASPGVLRLSVISTGPGGPLRVELTDQGGEARLYRNLSIAERGRGNDCLALADTVALIVERFLHDLGYELPPNPPPPPREAPRTGLSRGPPPVLPPPNRVDLFAGGSWRGTSPMDESDFEVGLGLGFERGITGRRVALTFTAGISTQRSAPYPAAPDLGATLRRVPVRLGLFMPLVLGPGWLEPGVRLALDWLFVSGNWPATGAGTNPNTKMGASPGAELALAYRVNLARRIFVRLDVSGGTALPYDVNTDGRPPVRLFAEPRFYVKSGLDLGFSFQ